MSATHDCGCGGSCCTTGSGHPRRNTSRLSLDVRVDGRRVYVRDGGAPTPLYVSRDLDPDCGRALAAWARGLGLVGVTPPPSMHVTVAYSKAPVDWFAMGTDQERVYVRPGGPRRLEVFKGGVVVLRFVSDSLSARWAELRAAGCSSDFPEYAPHVTLSEGAGRVRLDRVKAYAGELEFGPELFGPVKE